MVWVQVGWWSGQLCGHSQLEYTSLTNILSRVISHIYYSYSNNIDVSSDGIKSSNIIGKLKKMGHVVFGKMINLLDLSQFKITHI